MQIRLGVANCARVAHGEQCPLECADGYMPTLHPGLKDSIGHRPNKTNLIEFNSVKILPEFEKKKARIHSKFGNLTISHHSLEYSAKFRENLIKIGANFDEKR